MAGKKGAHYKTPLTRAKAQIGNLYRAHAVVQQTLDALKRARSDPVRQLAVVKQCLAKGGAPEKSQATAFEAGLRGWAAKQAKGIEALSKDLAKRKAGIASLERFLAEIPRGAGTPV